ncbi:MAG: hypothetical protein IPK59_03945 [Rhodospirillaceae bacterium]|nr:hypothetical protein [Rhodospirillaceae bacterium]
MPNRSQTTAALDLACLMQRLQCRRPLLSPNEREDLRLYGLRALAALNGHDLPKVDTIDEETARMAFEALCKAIVETGLTNADIVTWFNDSAGLRTAIQPSTH